MKSPASDALDAQRRARWPTRIAVGKVVKPHGVRGEVALEAWGELAAHVRTGEDLELKGAVDGGRKLTSVRGAHDRLIGTIEGCSDRDLAESFRGVLLEIGSSRLPIPEDGEFYVFELNGCKVFDVQAGLTEEIGVVSDVVEDGGGLLLEVEAMADTSARKIYTLPFVSAYLESSDFVTGSLTFRLPEGLLETCVSTF